jgi:hypothetical protein
MGCIVGNTLVIIIIIINDFEFSPRNFFNIHKRVQKESTRTPMKNSYCNFVNVKRRRRFLMGEEGGGGCSLIESTSSTGLELLSANESHHFARA